MNRISNNNPDVKRQEKAVRMKRIHKIYNTVLITSTVLSTTMVNALAAPAGVSTGKFNKVVNIVFWILECAIGIYGGSAVFNIVKGHNEEDPRTMKGGIAGLAIAACAAGAIVAIKKIFFD